MLAMRPDPGNVSPTDHPRSKKNPASNHSPLVRYMSTWYTVFLYCTWACFYPCISIYLSIYLSIYIYRYTYMYTYIISIYVHYDPLVSPIITYDNRSKAHGVNEDGRSSEAIDWSFGGGGSAAAPPVSVQQGWFNHGNIVGISWGYKTLYHIHAKHMMCILRNQLMASEIPQLNEGLNRRIIYKYLPVGLWQWKSLS